MRTKANDFSFIFDLVNEYMEILEQLVSINADINMKNNKGKSLLHLVIDQCYVIFTESLLMMTLISKQRIKQNCTNTTSI